MDTKILEKMGLTKNQSLVYLSLLKLGSTTAQNVIKESGLHRGIVYDSLEQLQEFGLVMFVVKDFKKYFQAARPRRLLEYLDEQREEIKAALPELERIESLKKEEIKAYVYKGKEGLKTIHLEMLKESQDIYVIGAKGLIFSELKYFIPNFERERIKKKIKFNLIYDKKKEKNFQEEIAKRQLYKGKAFPNWLESKTVVNIFGDKVAIVLWKEKYPTGFMIENKDVADSFRKWFKFMFSKL